MKFLKREHKIEIAIAFVYLVGMWWLLHRSDAYELLYDFTRQHEDLELDEVFLLIPVLLVVVVWFALRWVKEKNRLNEELRKANDSIRKLTKSREDFIAIAHHEMVNSLNSVTSAVELIDLSRSDEERKENIDQAKALSKGLHQYSSDMLSVVRHVLDEGGGRIEEFDLSILVAEAVRAARFKAGQKGVDFKLDMNPALPEVIKGNPKLVRHIVQNLAENSIKYTETGTVIVRCSIDDSGENVYRIQVCDTGIGVPSEVQKAIFDPYTTGQEEAIGEGVGLGLFIVKRLVSVLGGRISIKDNTPQGTVFTVVIPF